MKFIDPGKKVERDRNKLDRSVFPDYRQPVGTCGDGNSGSLLHLGRKDRNC